MTPENKPKSNIGLWIIIVVSVLIMFGRCAQDAERDRIHDENANRFRERIQREHRERLRQNP